MPQAGHFLPPLSMEVDPSHPLVKGMALLWNAGGNSHNRSYTTVGADIGNRLSWPTGIKLTSRPGAVSGDNVRKGILQLDGGLNQFMRGVRCGISATYNGAYKYVIPNMIIGAGAVPSSYYWRQGCYWNNGGYMFQIGTGRGFAVQTQSSALRIYFGADAFTYISFPVPAVRGGTQIMYTWSGSGNPKVYIDGVISSSVTINATPTGHPAVPTNVAFVGANDFDTGSGLCFLSEVRAWNRELTARDALDVATNPHSIYRRSKTAFRGVPSTSGGSPLWLPTVMARRSTR